MKKLFLIISSCILLLTSKVNACGLYYPTYSDYTLLYFMPHLFLDGEIKEMAKNGLYDNIIKKTKSPYLLIEQEYSDYLDKKLLYRKVEDCIKFYEDTLEDKNNLLALSHYAGSIFEATRKDSIILINDTTPASVELAAYHFSMMLIDPNMMYWAKENIDFMLNYKTCEWKKVREFCKNQNELDKVLIIESMRFKHLTASVLENYITLGGDINSEYFKLLLIKATLEFENNLKPYIKSKNFRNLYNYSQYISKADEDIYLDFVDFKKLLFKLKIQDQVLIHVLRGYTAFIEGDFKTAQQEYQYSKYLVNKSNKTQKEKNNIKTQIEFLNTVIDSYSNENIESYNSFIEDISRIIKKIPKNDRIDSYYKVGIDAALKKNDLVTAYQFSNFDDGSSQQLLEILMNKIDIHKILDLVQTNNLLFPNRFPANHKEMLTETLALKFLRTDNFDSAIRLLEVLEKDTNGLECCQMPYYINNNLYSWAGAIYDESQEHTPNHDELAKRSWPFHSDCYDGYNCRYDKIIFEHEGEVTEHNKITFIKEIKIISDSIKQLNYSDKKANLYYKLSQMYKEHFFNYNCIWAGNAIWQISSSYYFHFSLLGEEFLNKKMEDYMKTYSTIHRSEYYLKKAMRWTQNKELLAKYNFELLKIYEQKLNSWFSHITTTESVIIRKEEQIKKLIDSLYTNTNYFNEVIKECGTLYPKNKDKPKDELESKNPPNDSNGFFEKKANNYHWEMIFILSIIILIVIIKRYIKKEVI